MDSSQILLLPGWQDAGPVHWQSHWERLHGFRRVQQHDWWWPRRGDWMMQLEDALGADGPPAVLVAHGLACHLVAAWAGHSQHTQRVAAALLVAPLDIERADMPPQVLAWAPAQRRRLPFASTAVLSADDPFCTAQRSRTMAADWGSEVVDLGRAGHIDADSGLGDWLAGLALLHDLQRHAGLA